jgi:hypothetical protein
MKIIMSKLLYRTIKKSLHPDTTTDEARKRILEELSKEFNALPIETLEEGEKKRRAAVEERHRQWREKRMSDLKRQAASKAAWARRKAAPK